MGLAIMLILAYGPLNWVFPWWVWILATIFGSMSVTNYTGKE